MVGGQHVDDVGPGGDAVRRRTAAHAAAATPAAPTAAATPAATALPRPRPCRCHPRRAASSTPGPTPAAHRPRRARRRLGAPGLDELLEALEVGLGRALDDASASPTLLDEALRLVHRGHGHHGAVGCRPSWHRAGVRRPADGAQATFSSGTCSRISASHSRADAGDLGDPVRCRRAAAPPHAAHEAGELLELRPLVVGRPHRDVDLHGLDHGRHLGTPLARCGSGRRLLPSRHRRTGEPGPRPSPGFASTRSRRRPSAGRR